MSILSIVFPPCLVFLFLSSFLCLSSLFVLVSLFLHGYPSHFCLSFPSLSWLPLTVCPSRSFLAFSSLSIFSACLTLLFLPSPAITAPHPVCSPPSLPLPPYPAHALPSSPFSAKCQVCQGRRRQTFPSPRKACEARAGVIDSGKGKRDGKKGPMNEHEGRLIK